jgi:hypothetical protein
MHLACRRFVICAVLLSACPGSAGSQQRLGVERFGLWVIGPTAQSRGWASQWIEDAVRATPGRPPGEIVGWQQLLPMLLDVDAPTLGPPPEEGRAGGPSPGEAVKKRWPWEMTRPVPMQDMIGALRQGQLTVLVQVVAHSVPRDFGSRDSLWVLEAVAIAPWRVTTAMQQTTVLTTTRGVDDQSLRVASAALGSQLAAVWSAMATAASARAR